MKIEEGLYLTRHGYKARVIQRIRGDTNMKWLAVIDYGAWEAPTTHTDEGHFFQDGQESLNDLVERIEDGKTRP